MHVWRQDKHPSREVLGNPPRTLLGIPLQFAVATIG